MQVAMLHLDQRLHGGCRLGPAAVVSIGRCTATVAVHMLQLLRRRHASLACVLCSAVTGQSIQQLARCYMHARLENQSRCFYAVYSCTRSSVCELHVRGSSWRKEFVTGAIVQWGPGPTCMTPANEAEHDQASSATTLAASAMASRESSLRCGCPPLCV